MIDTNAGDFSKYESYEENFRRWRFEARKLMAELYDALNDHGSCKIPGISDQQLIDTAKHPIIKAWISKFPEKLLSVLNVVKCNLN